MNNLKKSLLRLKIEELSEEKKISKKMELLSNVLAVRYLQEIEGYERCFRRIPVYNGLKPGDGSGTIFSSETRCVEKSCTWYKYCNGTPPPTSGAYSNINSVALRDLIDVRAEERDLLNEITDLSDINAIRFLQKDEGYESCFGNEKQNNPNPCSGCNSCFWRKYCNIYCSSILPLDKAFISLNRIELFEVKKTLVDPVKCSEFDLNEAVGLKFKTFSKMNSITKKMILTSPKSIFFENEEQTSKLQPYLLELLVGTGPSDLKYGYERRGGHAHYSNYNIMLTSSISELLSWLHEIQSFVQNGNISYAPILQSFEKGKNFPYDYSPGIELIFDELNTREFLKNYTSPVSTPYMGLQDGEIELSDPNFAPILNIDIPIPENISLSALSKIMHDYPEELCSFRDFLNQQVSKMCSAVIGSETFYSDCHSIEREIRDNLRRLESDYKKTKIKTVFSLAGSAIASFSLAFYCILKGTGDFLSVLGPSGVAYQLSKAYSDYLVSRVDIKKNPAFLLWMIGETRKR